MAEELQGGFWGSNLWSSSIRCGDMLSCSMAVGASDVGGSFGWFPATAEIADHLSMAKCCGSWPADGTLDFQDYYLVSEQVINSLPAMDLQPQLSGFDLSPSPVDWSQSFLESPETNSHSAVLGEEEEASTSLMGYSETSHESLKDMSHGFFLADQILLESSSDDDTIQMPPAFGFSSVADHHQSLFDAGDAGSQLCPCSIEQGQTPKLPQIPEASPTDHQQDLKNSSLLWTALANNGSSLTPSIMISSDATEKPNSKASRDSILPRAKKLRIETPSTLPTFKVRKEKLGDRITALQQLVSPFGKTDTASVLHEAIGYIKFLHEQVGALSNPYLRNGHQRNQRKELTSERRRINGECTEKDLRSRGLCLVPFTSTFMVPNEIPPLNFWAPLWRKP